MSNEKDYVCSPLEKDTASRETFVRRVIFSEAGKVAAVVTATVSVILFIVVPMYQTKEDQALIRQKIETIEGNHLSHIQSSINDINERDSKQEEKIGNLEEEVKKLDVKMERVLTILEQENK